MIKSDELI